MESIHLFVLQQFYSDFLINFFMMHNFFVYKYILEYLIVRIIFIDLLGVTTASASSSFLQFLHFFRNI